jgi:hypothetical protein
MLDNRVLRILGSKKEETTGGLRKLHKKELNTGYTPPDVSRIIRSRRIELRGQVSGTVERKNVYTV